MNRLSSIRFVAIPAVGLALLVGVSSRAPEARAECIGLQSGSEYCVGEVARNSEDVVHTYEPGTFTTEAPQSPYDSNRFNGYSDATYPYYGESGYLATYSDNTHCFPC